MKFKLEIEIDQLGETSMNRIACLLSIVAQEIKSDELITDPTWARQINSRINGTPIRIGKWEIV